jgi:hypothetical protein
VSKFIVEIQSDQEQDWVGGCLFGGLVIALPNAAMQFPVKKAIIRLLNYVALRYTFELPNAMNYYQVSWGLLRELLQSDNISHRRPYHGW